MQLTRTGAGIGEQLGQRRHRQLGIHRNHEWASIRNHRDRGEVTIRIVGQRFEGKNVGDDRARPREQEGISVRRRTRDGLRPQDVPGAWDIFDNHGLAKLVREAIGNRARHDVDAYAGAERDTNLIGRVGHVSAGAAPLRSTATNTRSERRAVFILSSRYGIQANTFRPSTCRCTARLLRRLRAAQPRLLQSQTPGNVFHNSPSGDLSAARSATEACARPSAASEQRSGSYGPRL